MSQPAENTVVRDTGEQLVDVSTVIRASDLRNRGDGRAARVRAGVRERLVQAEGMLPAGLHLLLVEGHRSVGGVAGSHPAKAHQTGGAVDLTLSDADGHPLDLGDPGVIDGESGKGRLAAAGASVAARALQEVLHAAMSGAGFAQQGEWWHWSYGDPSWAAAAGEGPAIYGPADARFDNADDAAVLGLAARCDNRGRWGAEDELGAVNYVDAACRVRAAGEVRLGVAVSLARPLDTRASTINPRPAWHVMHLETERPYATADSLHLQIHGLATTHVDALGHMFLDGLGYNGVRQSDVVEMGGLRGLAVTALRDGVFTRGVLLDVAAAAGRPWLEPGTFVDAALLDRAQASAGVEVRSGDAVFVHVGLERREQAVGPEDPAVRAGLDLSAVEWLHRHEVAVYSGDCIERFPERGGAVPMPLHQIGIARMGLVLLDCPSMSRLVETSEVLHRSTFLLTVAPLVVRGGTGSPVNPIAVF